ncbi:MULTISPECIES: DnaJ family domain-containing protein [unclassified Streptomyces]|uniref:DnaJ family domain-containing protein n=1 Tax=Streptomyces sp. NPDC127129 TaxID=3345373 RepID=UPI00362FCC49
MTERKPPGVSFESFVDKQIREATERGDFRNLPGFGKPLDDDSAPYDALWWVKSKLHREGTPVLPPSLALRKEAEDAREAVDRAVSEPQVRRILGEINTKIAAALLRPPAGPPLNLKPFEVETVLKEWQAARAARDDEGEAGA